MHQIQYYIGRRIDKRKNNQHEILLFDITLSGKH